MKARISPLTRSDAGVAGGAGAGGGLLQEGNAGVGGADLGGQGARAVVDDDDLVGLAPAGHERGEAARQKFGLVQMRNDDGDGGGPFSQDRPLSVRPDCR